MYIYRERITLAQTDAAGVWFFAEYLQIHHRAYESYLCDAEVSLKEMLVSEYIAPIVHSDCDLMAPVFLGDLLKIQLSVSKLGTHSFSVASEAFRGIDLVAKATTVHVIVCKSTFKKSAIPKFFKEKLQKM